MTEQVNDDIRMIPLTQCLYAIVDECNYEKLMVYKWYAKKRVNTYYAARKVKGKTHFMHWDVLERREGFINDHRNGNGLDNRLSNLRYATRRENAGNMKGHKDRKDSKYKGVTYDHRRPKKQEKIPSNDLC